MIKVSLVAHTNVDPMELITFGARICYQGEVPELGDKMNVEGTLFKSGHHTTLQHFYLNFSIEGIAINDVTLGLHLANVVYNTGQRSGRFCSNMFNTPDLSVIEKYVKNYWPEVSGTILTQVVDYVRYCISLYNENLDAVVARTKEIIREERPKANNSYVEKQGPKIAQEQLRVLIPTILPTALLYTVNLSTLAALYRTASTPAMVDLVQKMADIVMDKWPELSFLFPKGELASVRDDDTSARIISIPQRLEQLSPHLNLEMVYGAHLFIKPEPEQIHPLDLLGFDPKLMDNNIGVVVSYKKISLMTMGQDQRHRTIRRGCSQITGDIYSPPVLAEACSEKPSLQVLEAWHNLRGRVPETLFMALAPYGARVEYPSLASLTALVHEQAKRLCWCAQGEIYELSRQLRKQLENELGKDHNLFSAISPNCVLTGQCGEGARYCGRNLSEVRDNPFPERRV